MDLAEKVVDDATSVTEADVQRLRDLGLTDKDVLDVVLAASARCFFSKTLDALGAEPDAAFLRARPRAARGARRRAADRSGVARAAAFVLTCVVDARRRAWTRSTSSRRWP